MNQQSKVTRTMIQGVVNNVFDICEANGVMPEREDFCYAINFWMEHTLLIKCLPGIPNKRLPVPEINYVVRKEPNHCIVCDKYTDGQTIAEDETVWMCFDCYINTPAHMNPYEKDEIWAFDEPHYSGGNCHITMTKQQAIDWTKKVYAASPKYKDATDEQFFDEFVAVHFAYKENEKESK